VERPHSPLSTMLYDENLEFNGYEEWLDEHDESEIAEEQYEHEFAQTALMLAGGLI
jgi:hypothetical protein